MHITVIAQGHLDLPKKVHLGTRITTLRKYINSTTYCLDIVVFLVDLRQHKTMLYYHKLDHKFDWIINGWHVTT